MPGFLQDLLTVLQNGLQTVWVAVARALLRAEPDKLVKEGVALDSNNERAKAIEKFTEAIQTAPEYARGYFWRGAMYVKEGKYEKAIADFSAGISVNSASDESINLFLARADACQKLGRLEEALSDCNKAIELCNIEPSGITDLAKRLRHTLLVPDMLMDAHARQAEVYAQLGKLDLALKALDGCTRALESQTGPKKSLTDHSDVYVKLGYWEPAVRFCDRILQLDNWNANAYNNRGISYAHLGDLGKAMDDIDQAIRISPGVSKFYANRGLVYAQMNQMDAAMDDFDRALELCADNEKGEVYLKRAQAYEKLGRHDLAVTDRQTATQFGYRQLPMHKTNEQPG